MIQTVTHKELARLLKVSQTTIKSYRRKFADCIPVASKGKPIRFTPEAVDVCLRIRDYFEMGMSIEEVRSRLAEEFSWIVLVGKQKTTVEEEKPTAIPKEFLISLSNMAKSMVTMTQQQNNIMQRMEHLEKAFEQGVSFTQSPVPAPTDLKSVLEDLQVYLQNALTPLQQFNRLANLEDISQVLQQAAATMGEAVQLLRIQSEKHANPSEPEDAEETVTEQSGPSSKVVAFSTAERRQKPEQQSSQEEVTQDPPRAFLLKPMVLRTLKGVYTSAGGRSGGRFTLNDLKALLAYDRQPSEHFSMIWKQQGGSDWMVTLTQPEAENPGTWCLHLREAMSQTGVGFVELVGFTASNGESVHPSEFFSFIARFSSGGE